MPTVCIDGANLSLAKGSGIAVYGRNLLHGLKQLGFGTQVLLGPGTPRHATDFMNEVAIADAAKSRAKKGLRRALSTVSARFGSTAYPIISTGMVQLPALGLTDSDVDSYWACRDVYNLSNRAFRQHRTFVPIRFDRKSTSIKAPDIVHWTAPMPLIARNAANVYTFHDLIPLRLPSATAEDKRAYFDQCAKVVRIADHIVTVSEASRSDLISMFGVDPNRVTNTYQAVDIPLETLDIPAEEVAISLERHFSLGWKDYYLFFGAIEPKKNVLRLVEAYLASGSNRPLVIVAGRSWLADPDTDLLDQMAKPESFGAGVRRLEYLPTSMLRNVIRGARATLFPSLMEGFGLPVLESMSLGTAVVTSGQGALGEVAGSAALTIDPLDVRAISAAIFRLDTDEEMRNQLEKDGLHQARKFSPSAYRDRLSAVYTALG